MCPTVFGVTPSWPVEEFREYLRTVMTVAQVPDFAELSRLSGVSQTQFSNWRRGLSQPSRDSLRKVATALGVPPVKLYLAAGLNDAEELDLSGQVDMTVLPPEIQEFIAMYLDARLTDEQRRYARRVIADVTSGLRAELARSQVKPSGRRRAG